MNDRERFHAVMQYRPCDRFPFYMVPPWPDTLARWYREGLPENEDPHQYLGIAAMKCVYAGPNTFFFPPFENRIVQEDDDEIIEVDEWGCLVKKFKYKTTIPECIEYPVTTPDSLRKVIDERYDPSLAAQRWADDWKSKLTEWSRDDRDYLLYLDGGCYYFTLRNLAGVENASFLLYDAPELCEELFERINCICLDALQRVLPELKVDYLGFGEDIAFKTGPLVSPEMIRSMLLPRYRKVAEFARNNGVDVMWYDSDGDLSLILDDLLDTGINCFAPLEVAAGMCPLDLRKKYGRRIRMIGGIDKRQVAQGPKAIRKLFREIVRPLLSEGGYLPAIDHSVSADISWDNYKVFVEELLKSAEMT